MKCCLWVTTSCVMLCFTVASNRNTAWWSGGFTTLQIEFRSLVRKQSLEQDEFRNVLVIPTFSTR